MPKSIYDNTDNPKEKLIRMFRTKGYSKMIDDGSLYMFHPVYNEDKMEELPTQSLLALKHEFPQVAHTMHITWENRDSIFDR